MRSAWFWFALAGACGSDGGLLEQALGPNGHHAIYLNFDGVTLQPAYDDAMHNQSAIAASVGHAVTVPPFDASLYSSSLTRDQVIADIVADVRALYIDFNVDVVAIRPTAGNFVMAAIGGLPDLVNHPCQNGGCTTGLADLDCRPGNPIVYNPSDDVEVVYIFSDTVTMFTRVSYVTTVHRLAVTIAQEVAHSYGLGHSNNPSDVMYPFVDDRSLGFAAGGYWNQSNCASGVGTQDAHALLVSPILGARQPGVAGTPCLLDADCVTPSTCQRGVCAVAGTPDLASAAPDASHIDLAQSPTTPGATTLGHASGGCTVGANAPPGRGLVLALLVVLALLGRSGPRRQNVSSAPSDKSVEK